VRKKGAQEVRLHCFLEVTADNFYFTISLVSTGIRFTTLPDATPPSLQVPTPSGIFPTSSPSTSALPRALPLQPPTTITALFNPMLGHMSSAYTARVSKDLSLSSRFDFNVYSFESEWTMGAEWWLRRQPTPSSNEVVDLPSHSVPPIHSTDVRGVVKARASTSNVSFSMSLPYSFIHCRQDVSLMWEGRLQNTLVSLGVVSDFSSRSKLIKSLGLEVSYFSSG
jgi:distribution and morphology protein 10